jgi:hypothetical protein
MLERLAQVSVRLGAAPSSIGPSHHRRGCLSTIATASARSGLRPEAGAQLLFALDLHLSRAHQGAEQALTGHYAAAAT